MTVYPTRNGAALVLMARAEGAGGLAGDAAWELHPGDSEFGRPYEWWASRAGLAIPIGDDGLASPPAPTKAPRP